MYLTLVSGHRNKIESALSSIVAMGCFHAVNTFNSINSLNQHSNIDNDLNIDEKSMVNLHLLSEKKFENLYKEKIEKIYNEMIDKFSKISEKPALDKDRVLSNDYEKIKNDIDVLYNNYSSIKDKMHNVDAELIKLDKKIKAIETMLNVDLDFSNFKDLNYIDFEVYSVTKENVVKIKANYENIPSILIKALNEKDECIYLTFTLMDNIEEAEKIFKSLNMVNINIVKDLYGKPKDVYEKYKDDYELLKVENNKYSKEMNDFLTKNYNSITSLVESLNLIEKNYNLRTNVCVNEESFFISGWVPENKIAEFEDVFQKSRDYFITKVNLEELDKNNFKPPTSLNNKYVFKSFETLVKMFGVPSYDEIDPTIFFAITYTLLFGLMFGDIGQGFIFLIAGLFLFFKLRRTSLGGIVSCLGISSMIFGCVYGSFFGIELHEFYIIKPMENVMDVLVYAISFGVILLISSYVLHLINCLKKKDYESAFFSKEGIAGLLLFLGILSLVVTKFMNINTMPVFVWVLLFIFLAAIILLKNPTWNLISKGKFKFDESKGEYFVENGFGIFELILNILSNTLSFIRVGAFALNHVGLFLAVSSISDMVSGGKFAIGSVFVYIIGNLIIIVLEGLVVFIQGLRLEYYELFSKYFDGKGNEYKPINLDYMLDKNVKKKTIESIINN